MHCERISHVSGICAGHLLPGVSGCRSVKFFFARDSGVSISLRSVIARRHATERTFELEVLKPLVSVCNLLYMRVVYLVFTSGDRSPTFGLSLGDDLSQRAARVGADGFLGVGVQE